MQVTGETGAQNYQGCVSEDFVAARRLWLAVIMQAIEDWSKGGLRARRVAQRFIFDEPNDFAMVCANAGLDPDHLRSRLLKIGKMVSAEGSWVPRFLGPVAA